MQAQVQQIQAAVLDEQLMCEKTRKMRQSKATQNIGQADSSGACQTCHKKDTSSKLCSIVQVWGSFQALSGSLRDFWCWHHLRCKKFLEDFELQWSKEQRPTHERISEICAAKLMDPEMDSALHIVVGAFLERDARVLSERAEVMMANGSSKHKYCLYFGAAVVLDMTRGMQPAKTIQDVMHVYTRKVLTRRMRSRVLEDEVEWHSVVLGRVEERTDLLNVLPDGFIREIKTTINIDFERGSYNEVKHIMTTIIHNHSSAGIWAMRVT